MATPKSRILTCPSFVTKTFSGLMSRWTIPFSCAAARPRDLDGVVDGFLRRQGSAELFAEGFALQKLRDDEGAAFVRADVVDDEDVGVIELGGGAGFLLEAREAVGIRGEAGVNDLDGDVAPESRVPRPVDLAHAAGAEGREDLVGAEPGARLHLSGLPS